MKIINQVNGERTIDGVTISYIVQFNEKEQKKVDSLEFYIDSLNHPQNFVYDNEEEKYNDKCLFEEYHSVSSLICDIFGTYTKIYECHTSMPGGYCCTVYAEKALCNNLAFVHVTEYYNI